MAAIDEAKRLFPNLTVKLQSTDVCRSLRSRMVANHTIAHLSTPLSLVDASGRAAAGAGFGSHFKLIWQLAGKLEYEDSHGSLTLRAGEMLITAMARDYHLAMAENFEALLLVFNPATFRKWQDIAQLEAGKAIPPSGAVAASAAGIETLLRYGRSDNSDALAVQSLVDMALAPLDVGQADCQPEHPTPNCLFRASLLIAQNIGDQSYGPDRLARDLGLSRRSLYSRFGQMGITPAAFIRQQRLARARDEILNDPERQINLITIALRHGFSDGASFSHSFKATYGVTPSRLRSFQNSH